MPKKKLVPRKFIEEVKRLGYRNAKARLGVDMEALGAEFGITYHAVRFWLNGTYPVPQYALNFVKRQLGLKNKAIAISPAQI